MLKGGAYLSIHNLFHYNLVCLQVYLVTGGRGSDRTYLSSTEILPTSSSQWTQSGALPSSRDGLRGVKIGDNFYVTGEKKWMVLS